MMKNQSIWKQQHALKPFVDPSNFKTYDELKEKLNRVITGDRNASTVENVNLLPQTNGVAKHEVNAQPEASDDDDTLSYFSKLAKE